MPTASTTYMFAKQKGVNVDHLVLCWAYWRVSIQELNE